MKCIFLVVSCKSGLTYWIFVEWLSLNSVVFHRYDQFAVTKTSSRTEKQAAIKGVLESLKGNTTVTSEIIHVKIPLAEAHKNHNTSQNCHFSNNIHYMVRDKILEYVSLGITSVPFLKKVLKTFVQKELSEMGSVVPHSQDPSYYPSSHVIQNHVHHALVSGKYSGFDQLQVEKKIDEWKLSDPSAKFFFRKCTENNVEQTVVKFKVKAEEQGFPDSEVSDLECNDTQEITSSQETFLFIHQNAQQQELLKRYGDMVLLTEQPNMHCPFFFLSFGQMLDTNPSPSLFVKMRQLLQ